MRLLRVFSKDLRTFGCHLTRGVCPDLGRVSLDVTVIVFTIAFIYYLIKSVYIKFQSFVVIKILCYASKIWNLIRRRFIGK